jgi:hypothetical protein
MIGLLADMQGCKDAIGYYLSKRNSEQKSIEELISEIISISD